MSIRRFLNLVSMNCNTFVFSLRRIDLSRQPLFYPTSPPPTKQRRRLDLQEMETMRFPAAASFRFRGNPSHDSIYVRCFGLSENKIVCIADAGLAFLYDYGSHSFVAMPTLHSPKSCPIYFSVPSPEQQDGGGGDGGGGSLYVMEKEFPNEYPDQGQFEAFIHVTHELSCLSRWERHSLPPPPPYFLDDDSYKPNHVYKSAQINSYAVLGGGSHLCISVKGHGTYCFDTASREWSRAGDWMLPTYGKAEYVPELDLWFGLADSEALHTCTCDLSPVLEGRQPILGQVWRNDYYPPEWEPILGMPRIVSLGSGRFCLVDFFETFQEGVYNCYGERVVDQSFGVFTGVELVCNGKGKSKGKQGIRMVRHMSRVNGIGAGGYTAIEEVL